MSTAIVPTRTEPSLTRVFLASMRSEWTKLRTVRSTVWALGLTVVLMIGLATLIMLLSVSRWDHRSAADIAQFDPVLYSFVGINLAQMCIGTLGILVMTSEYATGVIRLTFGATPQRSILLSAKVATFAGVTFVVSAISCMPAFFIGQAILASKHAGVSITDPNVLRSVIATMFYLVLLGSIGIGLGTIVRRTAAAVAILFAVLLVLPGLLMLLPSPWDEHISKFSLGAAGEAMVAHTTIPGILSPLNGFIVFVGYAVVTLSAAAFLLIERDA